MTGHAAWNRLFDETMSSLEFTIDDQALPLEVTLSLLQDADGARRKKAGLALAETFKANLRTFTLITNTLAKDKEISDRWRGFEDIADSRAPGQPGRTSRRRCAGTGGARGQPPAVAPLLRHEGPLARAR
jgi:oligoendopeptidase F